VRVRRVFLGAAAALLAAGVVAAVAIAAAPPPIKANPCQEVKNCKPTAGPWVAVPATGEATFLLECPKRAGTIGGTDVLASSPDVRVTWEGNPGSPVRPGTTTVFFAFFHASSAQGKPGLFQPYIGCIPASKIQPRSILSARITRPGGYLDRRQNLVALKPGASQTASEGCGNGERLLSGWYAVVFGSAKAPNPDLGSKVHATIAVVRGKVVASVRTDAGIPASASVQLQVGAVCAT
jgi:hypothetical protein